MRFQGLPHEHYFNEVIIEVMDAIPDCMCNSDNSLVTKRCQPHFGHKEVCVNVCMWAIMSSVALRNATYYNHWQVHGV
jgi:hypothetical protein